jgi:hypothetical protein
MKTKKKEAEQEEENKNIWMKQKHQNMTVFANPVRHTCNKFQLHNSEPQQPHATEKNGFESVGTTFIW